MTYIITRYPRPKWRCPNSDTKCIIKDLRRVRDAFKFGKLKKLGASKQLSFNPANEVLIQAISFISHCESLEDNPMISFPLNEYTSAQDGERANGKIQSQAC